MNYFFLNLVNIKLHLDLAIIFRFSLANNCIFFRNNFLYLHLSFSIFTQFSCFANNLIKKFSLCLSLFCYLSSKWQIIVLLSFKHLVILLYKKIYTELIVKQTNS